MNKAELIQDLAAKTGEKIKTVEELLAAFVESVENGLKKGDKIAVSGLGTLSISERKARKGRNPRTGEEIKIPASRAIKFTAGKTLKDAINKNAP